VERSVKVSKTLRKNSKAWKVSCCKKEGLRWALYFSLTKNKLFYHERLCPKKKVLHLMSTMNSSYIG